jgi:hypothetical protein
MNVDRQMAAKVLYVVNSEKQTLLEKFGGSKSANFPAIKSASALIGGTAYDAVQTADNEFQFLVPKSLNPKERLTEIEFRVSADTEEVKVDLLDGERSLPMTGTGGKAAIAVKDLLGPLDPQGDGVTVGTLRETLSYAPLTGTGEIKDHAGHVVKFKLTIGLEQ